MEMSFYQMKGDKGMGYIEPQQGKNKEWLVSKATQSYMTPPLYPCLLLAYESTTKVAIGVVSCSSMWLY